MRLSDVAERARTTIYRELVSRGTAPRLAELPSRLAVTDHVLGAALTELVDTHQIVLEDARSYWHTHSPRGRSASR